jgi:hypothetical protein
LVLFFRKELLFEEEKQKTFASLAVAHEKDGASQAILQQKRQIMTSFDDVTSHLSAKRGAAPMIVAALTSAAGLWVAISTLTMVAVCRNALPFGDQWGEIITGRRVDWAWLVSQHVEHRILFPRLVFWADYFFAHETNLLNEAVIVAIQCGLVAVLLTLATQARLTAGITRIWAAGLCLSLLFWAGQYQNFVWGFQVSFVGVVLAAAGTFATLALVRRPGLALAGGIIFESVGVYTLASGVLIPLMATFLAILLRRPRWHVALLAAVAVLLLASYLWGYHTPPESSDPVSVWRDPGDFLLYLVTVLGAPIGNIALLHDMPAVAVGVSAAAGALGIYAILRLGFAMLRTDKTLLPAQAALLVMSGFVLAMFAITAAGRLRFGISSAFTSRYASPAVVFWCCLIFLIASRASRSGRVPLPILLGAAALAVLMAFTEADNAAIGQDWVSLRRAATPAILAGVTDTDVLNKDYAIPARTVDGIQPAPMGPSLRAKGTSVFADPWATWLGTKLADHVAGLDPSLCAGALAQTTRVTTQPAPGYRAIGHAWRADSGAPIDRLVITDADGEIVGYGMGGVSLATIGIADPAPGARKHTDWIGAFNHAEPGAVTAYALVGQYACALAGHG